MCKPYVPLHCHSFYSLLDGMPSPLQIAQRAKEINAPAIAITDHGNLFGMMEHYKACNKLGIKPLFGCELYQAKNDATIKNKDNSKLWHLTILAKNQEGIKDLIALCSECNRPDYFYRKPRIDFENLKKFAARGNLICLSGCLAGELSQSLFMDAKQATIVGEQTNNKEAVRKLLHPKWKNHAADIIERYQKAFGKDNYYIELQEEDMPAQQIVVECLRQASKGLNVPSVATLDSHYCKYDDVEDHRILLCSQLHTTIENQKKLRESGGDTMAFFYRDSFYIFDGQQMREHYTDKEIENSLEIADKISSVSLGHKPCLPKYISNVKCLDNIQDSNEMLRDICIQSAKRKLGYLSKQKKIEYWKRLQKELAVIKDADLACYFLIVYDACRYLDEIGSPRGKGRGSGAGCLINYLLNITKIDPIEYGLYFERFYNISRNIPPHFNLGDYDFVEWLSENFEKLINIDINKYKNKIAKLIKHENNIKNLKRLKEEAEWIDNNNPKIWVYLSWLIAQQKKDNKFYDNPNNSHIAFAMRLTNIINADNKMQPNIGHISLPDIDLDIGIKFRSKIIDYLTNKWGHDKVSQMITFGRIQGKAALKEVFRAQPQLVNHLIKVKAQKNNENTDNHISPYDLCNQITKFMPNEAAIADELQQMRQNNINYGIIQWSIDNISQVKDAYKWYKPLFDQAMRLEGTKKSQSKHAAGIVIADRPIEKLVPMAYDPKSKTRITGVEMESAESMGCVKFDFLGVVALDKLKAAQNYVNARRK